jgi:hypothetical protein
MPQNNINNTSYGLTAGNLSIGTNTMSCLTGDFILNGNAANSILMKNGATTLLTISSSGLQTIANNPGFMARRVSDVANVTGDGTVYAPDWTSTRFDTAGNFSAPNFTAPVTGKYFFTLSFTFAGLSAGMTAGFVKLVTSNRTYTKYGNPLALEATVTITTGSLLLYTIADMDAGDTASVQVSISGGTKTADFKSFAIVITSYFNGVLIS